MPVKKKGKHLRLVKEAAPKNSRVPERAFTAPLLDTVRLHNQVEAAMLDIMETKYSFSATKAQRLLKKFRTEGIVSQTVQTVVERWFSL